MADGDCGCGPPASVPTEPPERRVPPTATRRRLFGLGAAGLAALAGMLRSASGPRWWHVTERQEEALEWWRATVSTPAERAPVSTVPPNIAPPQVAPIDQAQLPAPPPVNTEVPNRTITIPMPEVPIARPEGWDEHLIGWSNNGMPLQMFVRPPVGELRHRVLVICCVHGNERGTVPIGVRLMSVPVPDGVNVAIVPVLNPDGWLVESRWNARNVDLNRNFPWRWSTSDGGPEPGSEPETQAAMALVLAYPWDVVVWVHQPLGYVAPVAPTDPVFADTWARGAGLPFRSDVDQHGGGETWTTKVAGLPAILVEVATHDATADLVESNAAGYAALLNLFA